MCLKKMTKDAASVYDGYKKGNPLMMRKKMTMKDVVFRRDEPDREVFRMELAWDCELYILLAFLLLIVVFAAYKIAKLCRICG